MSAPKLTAISNLDAALKSDDYDAVVLVRGPQAAGHPAWNGIVTAAEAVDSSMHKSVVVLPAAELPGQRLVVASTGPLDRDYDDVRRFADAAQAAATRAKEAGATRLLLVVQGVPKQPAFAQATEAAALAAAGAQWQPLEGREHRSGLEPVTDIGVFGPADNGAAVSFAAAVEQGRRLARDLCGTEPERMSAAHFAAHCVKEFAGTSVTTDVVSDRGELEDGYPLLSAVARASWTVERHHPRVLRLEYDPGNAQSTLLFAGKGVVYDTGGSDVKAGGHMAGMSRDKGGAAAVAGLLLACHHLKPKNVRVVAEIGLVRNSVGADAYVSDEIITSHGGKRVRIGNTDAEGRLVLADLLSHLRQTALQSTEARLFSVATLTGHSIRAMGNYSIALDNGPARDRRTAESLSEQGELVGDPFEVSRLRRDDFDFVQPRSAADDVLSGNNLPSTATARGHQFPMAFLAIASGLDEHGRSAKEPLPFTHIDIGGSATVNSDWQHGAPTGSPVAALATTFLR